MMGGSRTEVVRFGGVQGVDEGIGTLPMVGATREAKQSAYNCNLFRHVMHRRGFDHEKHSLQSLFELAAGSGGNYSVHALGEIIRWVVIMSHVWL